MIERLTVICTIGLLLVMSCKRPTDNNTSGPTTPTVSDTISLLFAGDIMCHKPQVISALQDSAYNFTGWFEHVEPIIREADIAFANLETTLSTTGRYSGYPRFKSPDELGHAVAQAGFDVIVTANNHSNDTRGKGLTHTIDVLRSLGLSHTGTFMDSLDKAMHYPLLIHEAGISIALLNYTYDTNGVPTTEPTLVNEMDSVRMKQDIQMAKAMDADMIIVFMHWGTEYRTKSNYRQRRLTKMMLREGVDHIIDAHPHVVQEVVTFGQNKKKNLVAYSLGNFISNQKKPLTDGGIMIAMKLVKRGDAVQLVSWDYIPVWRYIRPGNKNSYEVIPTNMFLSDTAHFHSIQAFEAMTRHHEYITDFFAK